MRVVFFLLFQSAMSLSAMNYAGIRCTSENVLLTFSWASGSKAATLSYTDGRTDLLVKADHLRLSLHRDIGLTVTASVLSREFDTMIIFFDASMAGVKTPERTLLRFMNNQKLVSSKLLDCVAYKE